MAPAQEQTVTAVPFWCKVCWESAGKQARALEKAKDQDDWHQGSTHPGLSSVTERLPVLRYSPALPPLSTAVCGTFAVWLGEGQSRSVMLVTLVQPH